MKANLSTKVLRHKNCVLLKRCTYVCAKGTFSIQTKTVKSLNIKEENWWGVQTYSQRTLVNWSRNQPQNRAENTDGIEIFSNRNFFVFFVPLCYHKNLGLLRCLVSLEIPKSPFLNQLQVIKISLNYSLTLQKLRKKSLRLSASKSLSDSTD